MSMLVWVMMGIAIWHFAVWVPDRFWGGIVGAFLGACAGAMASGAIAQVASGEAVGETDIGTVLVAVPGTLIGLGIVYLVGLRTEDRHAEPV